MAPVTPTEEQIREKALALWMNEAVKTGLPLITPEDYELKEGNFWREAQLELMRSPELVAVEKELEVLHYQADHLKEVVVASETLKDLLSAAEELDVVEGKIKDLRSKRKEEKERAEKRVKDLEAEIERLRKERELPPKPPLELTVEERGRLAHFFLEKLDKAKVPFIYKYKPELDKALDIYKSYEENLKLIEEVADRIIAEVVKPPPPKVEMGLGSGEKRRLEDVFRRVFAEARLPRLPAGAMSAFRDELATLQEDLVEVARRRAFELARRRIVDVARTFIPIRPPPPRPPPAVIRVEIPAEKPRERTFETRYCWIGGEEFTHDVDLEMRLRKPVMRGRFAADLPALGLPEEFYHLCSEHKMERYNYYSMVDAVAFRVADRSKPNVGFTVTTLRGLGLTEFDIETIVLRAEDYGYKHSSLSRS